MAELLANWLNNEIELSQSVNNFEKDFSNGYLFGELLYKFNQQSNFKTFSKKDTVAAKIENFQMLETTLRNLKVKFDSKMVDQIMKEERGIALRLLYQLKMALEKVYPPTDIAVLRKTGKMGDNQPALKIAHSKEKYDNHAHIFFKNRLQELNKPQKQINMEKHLGKYEQEKEKQEENASKYHQDEKESKEKIKQEIRRAQINKLQRNAGFMEEWLQKGVEDWKKNQTIKRERERKDLEFEYKQANQFNEFTTTKINNASKEVHDGISNFEQTISKNYGIQTKVKKEDAERAVSEHLKESPLKSTLKQTRMSQSLISKNQGQNNNFGGTTLNNSQTIGANMLNAQGAMTLTSTGLKTKDKKTVTEKTRKERERRRRKMIVDQSKTHLEMDQKRRENQIIERMRRQAKQEEELAYEQWRTNQCKQIISENRKLREARYEKRRELDQQTAIWREEEMLKQQKEQMEREMQTFKERDFELRIVQKQAKREKRNEFAQAVFDTIFDIANEAYLHQQQADSQEIDPRNWKEWLQLFIDQEPIEGTLHKLAQKENNLKIAQEGEEVDEELQQLTKASEQLDQMELVDYIKNKGQWPSKIVKDFPINVEQFLTGQFEGSVPTGAPAAGAKGSKPPAKGAPVGEQIQLEEGDTELPSECPANFLLGDAIEMIININFDARQKNKRPQVPHFLNLKLCLVGYQFAGKKAQAQKIQEEYGLEVFYINQLVQEAISFFESHPEPFAPIPLISQQSLDEPNEDGEIKEKSLEEQINQEEDLMSEDSELKEDLVVEEDFRQCGQQIKDILSEGDEISDEIYVKLLVTKLRMTFPHKDKKTIRTELKKKVERELEIQHRIAEIEREKVGQFHPSIPKKKRKTPAQLEVESKELNKELEKISQVEKNGWVLVDFPSTFAQAKLLETALTGYVPPQECEAIEREKQIEDAYLLVQPNAKEKPAILLLKSGLDSLVWFDVERDECIRRALGRRYDQVNDNIYHIQDSAPLTTNAPLIERLKNMDEENNTEGTLIDRWIAFDNTSQSLQNWINQFGVESIKLPILNKIDANLDEEQTFEQIKEVVNTVLRTKQYQEDEIRNRIKDRIRKQEEDKAELKRVQDEEEELKRKQLEEGGEGIKEDTKAQEAHHTNKVIKPEPATERIGLKEAKLDNVDNDFKPTVLYLWQELSSNYKKQMKKVFSQLRGQRERLTEYLSAVSKRFLDFLHRPDIKQEKLEQFIKDFNDFSDQYADLREDDATKDELHQRVDILTDELWEIIEERKEQEIEERKKIMESGWIENELLFTVQRAQQLMQSEVDKFKASIQIIHDFYHAFEDKLIPELPAQQTVEIVQEGEELPPVEQLPEGADPLNGELYTYPRLDLIFSRALKAQQVSDVTQVQVQAADKKGAPPKGKDPKKQAEEEKPVEESQYTKEMKQAIKTEKAILRFRLAQIRNWALQNLKEMRAKTLKVYVKLEDWIYVSVKTENDAVEEMSIVIKKSIEEETKIQEELRIKFMDFCVDEKIMNFIIPPPERLPAMEQQRTDRFSIPQLKSVVSELESLAQQQDQQPNIPNKIVVDFLLKRLENAKTFGGESGLPDEWKEFTEFKFQTLVRNLDKYNNGSVNWKILATYLVLLKTQIPLEKEADTYNSDLIKNGKEGYIEEAQFAKVKSFFDSQEISIDRDYSHPFDRVQLIKQLLFRINKEQKDGQWKLNIRKFITNLKAKEMTMSKRIYKTFNDILLSQIEK